MTGSQLKQRLAEPRICCLPGIFDFISLKVADSMGFDALYMTGYGTVASHLGLPDAGLAHLQRHGGSRTGFLCSHPHPYLSAMVTLATVACST